MLSTLNCGTSEVNELLSFVAPVIERGKKWQKLPLWGIMSWFNLSQQPSLMQLLAHSPTSRIREGVKGRKLVG